MQDRTPRVNDATTPPQSNNHRDDANSFNGTRKLVRPRLPARERRHDPHGEDPLSHAMQETLPNVESSPCRISRVTVIAVCGIPLAIAASTTRKSAGPPGNPLRSCTPQLARTASDVAMTRIGA